MPAKPPAPITIDIAVRNRNWRRRVLGLDAFADRILQAALTGGSWTLGRPAELSVLLTGDAEIHSLNRDWRQKDKPTNVLSFPQHEAPLKLKPSPFPVILGDIAMAYETLGREARAEGKTFEAHFAHLLTHGVLHLLGYDHERSTREANRMERLEIEILAGLGYKNPYEVHG